MGRPGLPPGVYFPMLMVGYLEEIGSERGVAWRCRDSISLREFLGYGLAKAPLEHSTLSKTRKRLSLLNYHSVPQNNPRSSRWTSFQSGSGRGTRDGGGAGNSAASSAASSSPSGNGQEKPAALARRT